jgi:vitamin B12 transporter
MDPKCMTLLLLALAAGPAAAQETGPPTRVEPVVVTATKIETPAEEVGAAVTVIHGDDFRARHWTRVEDALRAVPGLDVQRFGGPGKLSNITIRGARPGQVQVLIDGMRAKNPTSGTFDFSDLSPDLIERIEVIRGPQSTLYGADAIGGVINVITKKGQGPFAGSLHQELGNHDTLRSRAEIGGAWRWLDYALSGSHFESAGQFKNDNTDLDAVSTRLGLSRLPGDSSVAFMLRYNRNRTRLPIRSPFVGPQPIEPLLDENARQGSDSLATTLRATTHPVSWWESEVRLSRLYNHVRFEDAPDPGVACPFLAFGFPCEFPSETTIERREAEWLNHVHVGKWSTSTVGLEYQHEEGASEGSTVFSGRANKQSVFFQQQFRLLDRLFTSAGFRVEDHSVFGTVTTQRGSLAYVVKGWGTRIRGGAGSGFRAPTFVDLFFPGAANPDLKPERSFSYDVGVDQRLWKDRVRLGATYFHNTFTDLITCCGAPTPAAPFGGPINVGRARSEGLEFTSEVDLLDTLTASVAYTYTRSKVLVGALADRPIPRIPRHLWNIGLTWTPLPRLSLFTEVHTSSRQFETFGTVYNTGHTRVDVGGTYRILGRHGFLRALEATARIQNLLDEAYAEVRGFPAPGITALAGLRVAF